MKFFHLGAMVGLAATVSGWTQAAPTAATSWHRLESSEFSLLSDASSRDMEEFAVTYAAFRHVVSERLVGANTKLPHSVIVLFKGERAFREHATESKDEKIKTTAVSSEVDGTALTVLSLAGDREAAMATMFEFETIWMLRRVGFWAPLWMSQGAGEVLSTLRVSKGRCLFGADDLRFRSPLQHDEIFPWPQFFGISSGQPEYNGKTKPGVYQAQAWELMHWILLAKEDGLERFAKLTHRLKTDLPVPAIEAVMGVSEAKFYRSCLSAESTTVWLPFDDKSVRTSWRMENVSEVELHVAMFEVLEAANKTVAAEGELGRAQLLAPGAAPVLEARAHLALRKNDKDEAASLYRRAIEAGSKNPRAYLQSAIARLDGSSVGGGTDYPGAGGLNVTTALGEIRQSLELAPGMLESYQAMGRAFFLAPHITDADVEELSRGVGPGRTRVLHYRALLFERLKKYDESVADFRAVMADPECSPQLRQSSEQRMAAVIFNRHHERIEALAKAKQFAEAQTVLVSARQENPNASDQYDRLSAWLSDNERATKFSRLRKTLDELVAEKKFAEARLALAETSTGEKNPARVKTIESLRSWVDESEALQHLTDLYQAKQWDEFRRSVQEFSRQFPNSNQLSSLRRSDQHVQQLQTTNGSESHEAPAGK